ncbi:hypothetical protein AB3X91_17240 [Paraburkholderia sp. BR14263]|uniref:hypothetical protein n=1 Tax=unclassified Paraburkholderia TaxID=2615204 RepID=UPI0034CD9CDF
MGRREEISEELNQLAGEIEKDMLRRRGKRAANPPSMPETHVRLELFITQHPPSGFRIHISMEPRDDGEPS